MRSDEGRCGSTAGPSPDGLAVALDRRLGQGLEHHPERRPPALAGALGLQRAAVGLDDALADGQAQPQAAELAGDRRLPLLERVEDRRQDLRLDADAGVDDLDDDPVLRPSPALVAGADGDRPALGGELHGVLDQVPEHLLEPGRVGVDVVVPGGRLHRQPEVVAGDLAAADLDRLVDEPVAVGDLPVQGHLAPDDPHHVQQVVDEPGLEVDVLADHLQRRADLLGVAGPVQHRRGGQQDRVQRRAQLVREDGEELGLRPVGRLGLLLRRPEFLLGPLRLGDITGEAAGVDELARPPT